MDQSQNDENLYSLEDAIIDIQSSMIQSGLQKGEIRTTYTLFIGPYKYRRKKTKTRLHKALRIVKVSQDGYYLWQ